jgi:hypothetical protein
MSVRVGQTYCAAHTGSRYPRAGAEPTPRARSVLAPAAQCSGELVERLEHKIEWRPLLERVLEQLGFDGAISADDENDRPRHTVGLAAGRILRITQTVSVDDLRLGI